MTPRRQHRVDDAAGSEVSITLRTPHEAFVGDRPSPIVEAGSQQSDGARTEMTYVIRQNPPI